MTYFDAYLAVDWSARSEPTPKKPSPDAVWVGERIVEDGGRHLTSSETYFQTRTGCVEYLRERLVKHGALERRVLIGFDFAYGYPSGFASAAGIAGVDPPWRRVWSELASLIEDCLDATNNRFCVANELNARCRGTTLGPFWTHPAGADFPHLGPKGATFPYQTASGITLNRLRETERPPLAVQEVWKLLGAGAVGSQALLGIPAVKQLRDDPDLQPYSRVWPFETGFSLEHTFPGTPFILHAEIWPGVVNGLLDPLVSIKDQAQVRAMVNWLAALDASGRLVPLFERSAGVSVETAATCVNEEGWILGAGMESPISVL